MKRLGVERAVVDGRWIAGDVAVEGDRIAAVGLPGEGRGLAAPGFVDLQVNGCAGVDFADADRAGYARAGAALLDHGVTAFQPTFVTAPVESLVAALGAIPAEGIGPRMLGAHVEGPFLSPSRPGAHDPAAVLEPDPAVLDRLLAAGRVGHVTLAPERSGALELVDRLVAAGVTVALGHSDATAEEAHAAFDRGARTITHLFNAMRRPAGRDPGIGVAALTRPDVTVQLIADGHHLAPETLALAWAAAGPDRFALVSDAVAPAGMPDGEYRLGPVPVILNDGVVRTRGGALAGSASHVIDGVRTLVGLGVPLAGALGAASAVPARIAGRPDLGRLVPGALADAVVLDDDLGIRGVWLAGEPVRG